MIRALLVAVTAAALTACGQNIRHLDLTGCDHPSGWRKEIRGLAVNSWPYAQLSYVVYNKQPGLSIAPGFQELSVHENKSIGFYAVLFEDARDKSLVFVIRGTEDLTDWKKGNFAQDQNNFGLESFKKIATANPGRNIVVAGHSLGGGVAMHISLNEPVQAAYSFNGSPNFRMKGSEPKTKRYSIVEYGEILKFPRVFGREATQLYTSIGCSEGDPITQHDQLFLATCLTQIAAADDPAAAASLVQNAMPRPKWLPAS